MSLERYERLETEHVDIYSSTLYVERKDNALLVRIARNKEIKKSEGTKQTTYISKDSNNPESDNAPDYLDVVGLYSLPLLP